MASCKATQHRLHRCLSAVAKVPSQAKQLLGRRVSESARDTRARPCREVLKSLFIEVVLIIRMIQIVYACFEDVFDLAYAESLGSG